MNINWIDTHGIYQAIIAAPDAITREQLYTEQIMSPWGHMMAMVAGRMGNTGPAEPFAGPRAWHWLLPDQLATEPETLTRLETADAWRIGQEAMQRVVNAFQPYSERIPIDTIEGWLILADPATSDPILRGYTGGIDFMQPRFIVQFSEVNDYTLPRLGGCIVHEMHHLIRTKVAPWNIMTATLGDYMIHEGLAESFAGSLFGQDRVGYYVTEFDEGQIETARQLIRTNLNITGFDALRAFIFGDHLARQMNLTPVGMPDYGGYAIGYRVVQAYLKKTGNSIEAATFLPAAEIIAESGYFD